MKICKNDFEETEKGKETKSSFLSGLFWNYGSILFLAVGGLVFNVIIMAFYDAEILGIFNQVYAYYILLSQLAVFGIQTSVTKYSSQYCDNAQINGKIYTSGILASAMISVIVIGLSYIIIFILHGYVEELMLLGISSVLPGLLFFSINKITLGYLNGNSSMKAYAVFQSLRNILIAGILFLLAFKNVAGVMLVWCFPCSELCLFICMMIYLKVRQISVGRPEWKYLKEHIQFGFYILPGNLILEFNAKLDIIALGWILSDDRLIGYYSFASLFSEGFYQLYVVVRRNLNPFITRFYCDGHMSDEFYTMKSKVKHYVTLFSIPGVLLLTGGFACICYLANGTEYLTAFVPLVIISSSIALNGRYIIFGNLLSQTGFPVQESLINLGTVICNMILNLIFIYSYGLIGAAVATATSYFVSSIILRYFAKKKLAFQL